MKSTFAVIGAGMSGLAAADAFATAGHHVELIEASGSVGGRIGSTSFRGRNVELGGKNIGKRYTHLRRLVARFGGGGYEEFGINTSRQHGGRIVTLDSSSRWRTTARYLRGAPPRDVLKLGRHAIRVLLDEANRFLASPYFTGLATRDDEQLDAHFSPGFATSVVRPMTVRMNGAEPDEAYLGNFGTNLGMWLDSFDQLSSGLGPVLERIAGSMTVLRDAPVATIERNRNGSLAVRFDDGSVRNYHGVVLAVPASAACRIVRPLSARAAEELAEVHYHPVTVVLAEYSRAIFSHDRRAYVFGQDQPLSNAGAYGLHDLQLVRYTFSGRTARAWMSGVSDDELIETGERLLARYVPVDARARLGFLVRRFVPGLCAYSSHHARRLATIRHALAGTPIALAGDYLQGASLEACTRSGAQAAAALASERPRTTSSKEERVYV
jgi:oxygen-dependent protoporphyrinogen oxidase